MQGSVVAMGGNSLLDTSVTPTVENQFAVTARAMAPVAELVARGERLVLTHGNGPQVGFMQLRSELSRGELHEVPLDSLVADSQGALGYMIQRELRGELAARGLPNEVASIVTEVLADPADPAFAAPTKPVGKFYSAEDAERFKRERGWQMVEDSKRGFRRVVPSPEPVSIVQLATIKRLVESGVTVIACGGGGIPVVRGPDGHFRGLEAVVDKDRTSALLAVALGVPRLVITTGVDAIYRDFLTDRRTLLRETTVSELSRLHADRQFPPGSMGPKVEAAIYFLERGGEEVIVCRPEALVQAWSGQAGTRIRKG
ncbi:MAG: carbamate kinase [Polyangiaceae bacterium]|nr:carbamate kinase [Polyangiaceae bacterium]